MLIDDTAELRFLELSVFLNPPTPKNSNQTWPPLPS